MAKPIIYNLKAMNSEEDNTISFSYSGGLIKSNTIMIKSASDNSVVYTGTYSSARGRHLIPANSIDVETYGTQYYIQIKVTENDDTESSWSDTKFAIFIRSPRFNFSNVTDMMQVHQSYLEAELSYEQDDDELLQEYAFYLYDYSKIMLSNSPVKYDIEEMKYTYNGLEDGVYYIRAIGNTVHDYQVDTGYIEISVDYVIPEVYTTLILQNNYNGGYITYETNIVSIDYIGDIDFEFEDGMINLLDNKLIYNQGFKITDNATFRIEGKNLIGNNVKFVEIYDSEQKHGFYISSYVYDDGSIRYKLIGLSGLSDYVLYSPSMIIDENDLITFWIRRQNGIYLFKVYVNGEVVN